MQAQQNTNTAPWLQDWPAGGLEVVQTCPVCGSGERSALYKELSDKIFRAAPGYWTLYRCKGCRTAYLDPRPNAATIHIAYSGYYTHALPEQSIPAAEMSFFRRLRRSLANGYSNWKFGTKATPANRLGVLAACLMPTQRRLLDYRFRFLVKPHSRASLLDVGCGNGAFLEIAQEAGWNVEGLDIDSDVVKSGRSRGLRIGEGTISSLGPDRARYDAITMHHVIEHVHDPLSYLRAAHKLLRPGGQLYIETPNIESLGHKLYKQHWRGLEPPRHLVLFSRQSLMETLTLVGFRKQRWIPMPEACDFVFSASAALEAGLDPNTSQPCTPQSTVRLAKITERLRPSLIEFATVVCTK